MSQLAIPLLCVTLGQAPVTDFQPPRQVAPLQPPPVEFAAPPADRFLLEDAAPPNREPASRSRTSRDWDSRPASRPTSFQQQTEQPMVPIYSERSDVLAATILKDVIHRSAIEGKDVALIDILRRTGDSASRGRAVQSYWQLCIAIADRNFAAAEAQYLARLPRPESRLEQVLLQAERTRAAAVQSQAAVTFLKRQEEAASAFSMASEDLPRPSDFPFAGPYRTKLKTIFAGRNTPRRLAQIDRALPHQLDVVERRAEAVAAGEQVLTELTEAYAEGAAGVRYVLDSLQSLSDQRREFLQAVLNYNQQIAEYALAVAGPSVPPQTLLSTLIRIEAASSPTLLADSDVRPASAEEPVENTARPKGFRELRPRASPRGGSEIAPGTRSILRRVTIDHAGSR